MANTTLDRLLDAIAGSPDGAPARSARTRLLELLAKLGLKRAAREALASPCRACRNELVYRAADAAALRACTECGGLSACTACGGGCL